MIYKPFFTTADPDQYFPGTDLLAGQLAVGIRNTEAPNGNRENIGVVESNRKCKEVHRNVGSEQRTQIISCTESGVGCSTPDIGPEYRWPLKRSIFPNPCEPKTTFRSMYGPTVASFSDVKLPSAGRHAHLPGSQLAN